jgi:hypothetical protein
MIIEDIMNIFIKSNGEFIDTQIYDCGFIVFITKIKVKLLEEFECESESEITE